MKRISFSLALIALVFTAAACGSSTPTAPAPTPTRIITLSGNLAFGTVLIGASATQTLTISNSGTATLTISGINGPGGFTASWTSGTIPAGASQAVTVGFAPTSSGTISGTVTVTGDQTTGINTIPISAAALPNYQGNWIGSYVVQDCTQATGPSGFCAAVFPNNATFPLTFQFTQSGATLTGKTALGSAVSDNFSSPIAANGTVSILATSPVLNGLSTTQTWALNSVQDGKITGTVRIIFAGTAGATVNANLINTNRQ